MASSDGGDNCLVIEAGDCEIDGDGDLLAVAGIAEGVGLCSDTRPG